MATWNPPFPSLTFCSRNERSPALTSYLTRTIYVLLSFTLCLSIVPLHRCSTSPGHLLFILPFAVHAKERPRQPLPIRRQDEKERKTPACIITTDSYRSGLRSKSRSKNGCCCAGRKSGRYGFAPGWLGSSTVGDTVGAGTCKKSTLVAAETATGRN